MLAEHLVAAISARSAPSPTPTKDGGIFLYEFQPVVTQKAIFKKSAAPPNCVAVNDSHIFAGQVDKAVVHVYNREKGNQEAIIPFPERITCLTLAALGTLLVLGTQGGRLILWEVCTGRQVITSPSHLQAVTAVAVDPTSNFAFTVSTDTYIHIWSLPRLLAFNATPESLSPTNTISAHRSSISALTVGHSTTAACFAISSDDGGTVQVWDIRTGNILKSYLTAEASRVTSLAVDPADRGFYIGFEDGSVQMVHFFSQTVKPSIAELSSGAELTRDPSHLRATNTPVALQQISRWIPEVGNQTGPVLSLALSWDGTMLLSGHTDGRIIAWDIGSSRYESTIATLPGPVSNLMILHPIQQTPNDASIVTAFSGGRDPLTLARSVVKPRYGQEEGGGHNGDGNNVPANYSFTASFRATCSLRPKAMPDIDALFTEGFDELCSLDLQSKRSITQRTTKPVQKGHQEAGNFTSMADEETDFGNVVEQTLQSHDGSLRARVSVLEECNKMLNKRIDTLLQERAAIEDAMRQEEERKLRSSRRRHERVTRGWAARPSNLDPVNFVQGKQDNAHSSDTDMAQSSQEEDSSGSSDGLDPS